MTLDDLRKIAEAPGSHRWAVSLESRTLYIVAPDGRKVAGVGMVYDEAAQRNSEFIETFNPERVLELLDENKRLRADVQSAEMKADHYNEEIMAAHEDRDKALTRLAAVEKLHRPTDGHNPECHCGVPPNDGRDCRVCQADAWPCDTIKAVRGE